MQIYVFEAWFFLGLKGTEEEIKQAYKDVNTNAGDQIDMDEFKNAIKGSRMAELSLKNVPGKMGVELQSKESMYEAFKATERRRRMMKRGWEVRVSEFTSEQAVGEEGYLSDRGLIPLPQQERDKFRESESKLDNLKME